MRTLTIQNFGQDPPTVLATVTLLDSGEVAIECENRILLDSLKRGVADKTKPFIGRPPRVLPDAGVRFFDAVLHEFAGAYVRAVEQ